MNLKEIKFEMAAEAVNPKAELELIRLDRAVRFGSASLSRDRAGWCIDYCDAGTECAETFDMAGNSWIIIVGARRDSSHSVGDGARKVPPA